MTGLYLVVVMDAVTEEVDAYGSMYGRVALRVADQVQQLLVEHGPSGGPGHPGPIPRPSLRPPTPTTLDPRGLTALTARAPGSAERDAVRRAAARAVR